MIKPEISIVLGSYNRKWLLKLCIQSIRENGVTVPYEIIVVDGGSTDGAIKWLLKQKDIITIVHKNHEVIDGWLKMKYGWGYFMNMGFRAAHCEYICMVSDDCILHPGAVMYGYNILSDKNSLSKKIAACAFYCRNYPQEQKFKVGLTLGGKLYVNNGVFRRDVLEEVGWIDEKYRFYCADGDLCLKMWQKGYRVVDCPEAKLEHFVGEFSQALREKNFNEAKLSQDWDRALERWTGIFYDPAKDKKGGTITLDEEVDVQLARKFLQHQPIQFHKKFQQIIRRSRSLCHRVLKWMRKNPDSLHE